jgi:aldehyde dehydrogenase (NAD+)
MSQTTHPEIPAGRLYVGGTWVSSDGADEIAVENPATLETLGSVAAATAADVEAAVSAAASAAAAWSGTPREERAALLRRAAALLGDDAESMAQLVTAEVGTPIRMSRRIQAALPVTDLELNAEYAAAPRPEEEIGNSLVVREPIGVVAAITPWNYPLHQITAKVGPALAAGCTIVVKPSEVAPLAALRLWDVFDRAGFPPGVVNLVTGGPATGEELVTHPAVDAISFTGSVAAGSRVAELAAADLKRVTLELGGKSANLILEDADLATAVKVGVANAFLNAGQTCTAWTRMLVPRSRHDEAVELATDIAQTYQPGDPTLEGSRLGPLVSARQLARVRGFVERAVESGAWLACGGVQPPEDLPRGHYLRPTVFGNVDPDSELAQEEIFGPVLSILPYDDEDDAVRIANHSRYGLHGAVWGADRARAMAVARRMRTGQVDINGGAYNPQAPFGGYKQSGVGREMGPSALHEFEEVKSIQL